MDFENQIIPAAQSGGATTTLVNGGETLHQGIETNLRVDYGALLGWSSALYTDVRFMHLADAKFTRNTLFGGNRLPYAPENTVSFLAGYRHRRGVGVQLNATYIGDQFADNNQTIAPSADGTVGVVPSYTRPAGNSACPFPPGQRRPPFWFLGAAWHRTTRLPPRQATPRRVDLWRLAQPLLSRVRGLVLGTLILGMPGTGAELLVAEHTEDYMQWVPLLLILLRLSVLGWHRMACSAARVRALQLTMVLFLVGGAAGLLAHWQGKMEFKREMDPPLSVAYTARSSLGNRCPRDSLRVVCRRYCFHSAFTDPRRPEVVV